MALFRPALLAASLALALAACSGSEPPAGAADVAEAPANNPGDPANSNPDPATTGDAATLDARLVELGWAGSAATTHAYAEACGASASQLDGHLAAQRAQAASMGSSASDFDRQFEQALPIAKQRVTIDDVAMSSNHRAETCQTMLASLP